MSTFDPAIAEVARSDSRYSYEAYEFVLAALSHTQALLQRPLPDGPEAVGPEHHVTGRELLLGVRDLALREFGLMARTVFRLWGVERTDDFGEMIFNLIDAGRLSKTESDQRGDFHGVYDLDRALSEGYTIRRDGAAWPEWSEG
jgi:uncharacterized repeat protein (TIGR04138 family)